MTVSSQHEPNLAELKAAIDDLGRGLDGVEARLRQLEGGGGPTAPRAGTDGGEPPLMVFVEIPQTGGRRISSMFADAWPKGAVHKSGNYFRGREKTMVKVIRKPGGWESWHGEGGRLTVGNNPYRVFHEHLPAGCWYMTLLREPVDRVLFNYRQLAEREPATTDPADGPVGEPARTAPSSLEAALADPGMLELSNLATRFLCDDPDSDDLGSGALDEAKVNLRDFAFVGIQERFEESVALLQLGLGLAAIPYGEERSIDVHAGSDEERTLIEEHNRLDVELYAFACELFEERLAAAGPELTRHLEQLRAASAAAQGDDGTAVQEACEWLDRELPAGATKTRASVMAAARAAGIKSATMKRAIRQLPGVEKSGRGTDEPKLTRTG
jgi:hypothetical protein